MEFELINEQNLALACENLIQNDSDLAFIYRTYGTPPLWKRAENFPTLIHIILEQQVSLASARSAFEKLKERLGEITPQAVLSLSDAEMKQAYFSRQKTVYVRELALAIIEKRLDLERLPNLSDEDVKIELKRIKGIGDWTSDIYLLMAMSRPDVMPKGDLALHAAYKKLKNLEHAPHSEQFQQIAEKWKPFRSVAARLLWHFYLSNK